MTNTKIKPDNIHILKKANFDIGDKVRHILSTGTYDIFVGDHGELQPFSFLDDYDLDNFKKEKKND